MPMTMSITPVSVLFTWTNLTDHFFEREQLLWLELEGDLSFLQRMPLAFVVVILGIIEGITEFLPVSSTGHLLIAERWLPHQTDLFNVVIQCGAVLAVLPLFPHRLNQFFHRWNERPTQDYLLKILVAFAITGAGGLVLEKKHFKLPEELMPVAVALFVGGVAFVVV